LAEYTARFTKAKPMRTLEVLPSLGLVTLDIDVAGEPHTFSVSPPHAACILKFGERDTWSTEDLAAALQVSWAWGVTLLLLDWLIWQTGLMCSRPRACC
jgi:hypothetical protein